MSFDQLKRREFTRLLGVGTWPKWTNYDHPIVSRDVVGRIVR